MGVDTTAAVTTVERRVIRYLELAKRIHAHHDPDTIHDFRVASRNLLVTAPLLAGHSHLAWQRQVKNWLKSLNRLRDLQVLEERLRGNADVSDILKAKVEYALRRWERECHQVVPKPFRQELNEVCQQAISRISRSPAQFETDLKWQYDAIRTRLIARLDEADTARPATLHRLRIAYKSFRYMVALLHDAGALSGLDWDALKRWQDILGAIQDDEVAIAWLLENRLQESELIRSIQLHSEQLRQQFHAELLQFRKFVAGLFKVSESIFGSVQPLQ